MKFRVSLSTFIGLSFLAAASMARAGTIGVTDFTGGQGDFVFTNNGTSATWDTIPGGAAANFSFDSTTIAGLPSDLLGNLAVHVVVNSTTSTGAANLFGFLDIQPIDSGTVQVLLDTPIDGMDNLLTATFQNGAMTGVDGGSTSDFSVTDGNASGVNTYTSDFLDFGGTTSGNAMQFISSNANPDISIDGNFLGSFSENGLFTFDYGDTQTVSGAVTAVPLPSTAAASMLLLAMVAGLRYVKRSREARVLS